jgi:hypothetical protein
MQKVGALSLPAFIGGRSLGDTGKVLQFVQYVFVQGVLAYFAGVWFFNL